MLPGDTLTVEAVVHNQGESDIEDIHITLEEPDGWDLTPVGSTSTGVVKPGESYTAAFELSVPRNHAPAAAISLTGSVYYKKYGGTVEVPVETSVTVESPVTITSLKANPETIEPGGGTSLQATVHNKGQHRVEGRIAIEAPEHWKATLSGQNYELEPGEEQTFKLEVRPPLNATESSETLQVVATYDKHVGDQASATVQIRMENPPSFYYDHVDAGEPESEKAHNLQASPSSGTNVEAGLTRRYSNRGVADAYFQYDMKVEPGEPFVIRAVETYDQAQIKDYYIYVDGVKVHSRYNQTSEKGIVTYQFVVDDVSLTEDGIVTVRFQEDERGLNYDPSIADVWTMPYVDVDVPLSAAGIKMLVERYEEEEGIADERAAHSLKLHLAAVSHFEEKGLGEKVAKHMENFVQLLDYQQKDGWLSHRAYHSLKANTQYLINKWK